MKRILGLVAAIVVLTAMAAPYCWACECIASTKKEQAKAADVIFTGTVREVEVIDDGAVYRVRFRVWKVYKGHPRRITRVFTSTSGSLCGDSFEEGVRYTVFSDWTGNKKWTNHCAGNKQGGINPDNYGLPDAYAPKD